MILDFDPERYPRTMPREEWIRTYRWVRETRKRLKSDEERMLAAALLCSDDRIKRQMLDNIIYPPILMVPDVLQDQEVELHPGAISYITKPRKRFLP